jgi:hypothetical protein
MSTTTGNPTSPIPGMAVERDTGLPGRVIVSWTLAGALVVGGFLVAAMTLAGRMSGSGLMLTSAALYAIGAGLGLAHGIALAYFGRPAGTDIHAVWARIGMGVLYAVPALLVGFLVAGWIAMTSLALYLGTVLPIAGAAAGWLVGIAILMIAAAQGWQALLQAYARWPEKKLGTLLVAAVFAALLVVLLSARPEIWGLRIRVTPSIAVLLAFLGAFWVTGPAVTVALWLRRPAQSGAGTPESRAGAGGRRMAVDLATAAVAGAALALVALPFQQAAFSLAATGSALMVVADVTSRALVDGVLLRLCVITFAAWALASWYGVPSRRAMVYAVVLAAAAQALLYLPGALAIGFPGQAPLMAYVAATVLLPGLVLGALFATRGLPAAVLAHATALLLVALLV